MLHPLVTQFPVEVGYASGTWRYSNGCSYSLINESRRCHGPQGTGGTRARQAPRVPRHSSTTHSASTAAGANQVSSGFIFFSRALYLPRTAEATATARRSNGRLRCRSRALSLYVLYPSQVPPSCQQTRVFMIKLEISKSVNWMIRLHQSNYNQHSFPR